MSTDRPRIVIDPAVAFGAPLVKGTPVDAVAGMLIAGEPLNVIADNYNLSRPEILVACWHLAMSEPRWQAWRPWADRAHPLLARTPVDYDRVPDPPLDLTPEPLPELTARELQVLAGIAAGKTNDAIGRSLGVSPDTVKCHLGTLYRKVGARGRTEAVARAYELGLIGGGR